MKIKYFVTKQLEKLLAPFPPLFKLYALLYKNLVQKEIVLGRISRRDLVLCIGGGPLPCTALEIACRTGAWVQVIDNDPKAVEIASRFVARLELGHLVKVVQADGQQVDASRFTVVHVARQVFPREEIFNNVWASAPDGARILMRGPFNWWNLLCSYRSRRRPQSVCQCHELQGTCLIHKTVLPKKKHRCVDYEKDYVAFDGSAVTGSASLVG